MTGRMVQLSSDLMFRFYEAGIRYVLTAHAGVLLDASTGHDVGVLAQNLQSAMPHLWLVVDDAARTPHLRVLAICSLSDVVPGRHVYLHGALRPGVRRLALASALAIGVMHYAFNTLKVIKIKTEFEADNRGALGFCLRMGFRREALLLADNRVGDTLKDVALYGLTRARFRQSARRVLGALSKTQTESVPQKAP